MKTKILLTLIFGIFLLSLVPVMALDDQGVGKQGKNFTIVQVCKEATYVTLGSIQLPDRTTLIINQNMTFISAGAFEYNFSSTLQLGRYDVTGISDGCENTFAFYFETTPSGRGGSNNVWLFIIMILFAYGITLLGFFKGEPIVAILGGMFMLYLGIYLINNGIIIYRDTLTNYFAYLTIALGGIAAIGGAISLMEE